MFYLGIDIGGTNLKVGVFDERGVVQNTWYTKTATQEGPEGFLKHIISLTGHYQETLQLGELSGIGLGIPGLLNRKKTCITSSSNLNDWENFPLRDYLETETSVPVIMENDADMAALGEFWKGAGKEFASMLMLTLGSGVGGAIIMEDQITELNGFSSEFGHMIINFDGPLCRCGNRGCLETYSGRHGIQRMLKQRLEHTPPSQSEVMSDTMDAWELSQKAIEGQALAREIFQEAGQALGVGIANIMNMLRVDQVVIGGGIANAWEGMLLQAEQTARNHMFQCAGQLPLIKKAELGEQAGIIGAGLSIYRSLLGIRHQVFQK